MGKVRFKATEFGTTVQADGQIVHFDPSRKGEKRYLGGTFDEGDARRFEQAGLGKIVGDADEDDEDEIDTVLPNNDAAEERLAEASKEDDDQVGTSALSTAATIAFPNNPLNATSDGNDGFSPDDDDAPPPARRRAPAARKPASSARKPALPKGTVKAEGEPIVTRQAPAPNVDGGTNNDPPA